MKDELQISAVLIRKYNLGDLEYFKSRFHPVDDLLIAKAWENAQLKIQNREIIKDAQNIGRHEHQTAEDKFKSFDKQKTKLNSYLLQNFDPKELKLSAENTERRFRHLLALEYVELASVDLKKLSHAKTLSFKERVSNLIARYFLIILVIGGTGIFVAPKIIDKFTDPNKLGLKLYESKKNRYQFNGSICNDGWTSHSQGRGTCSHHNGVDYEFYKGDYIKSLEVCVEEAKKISWID